MVSGQGKSKACFATLAERKTFGFLHCHEDVGPTGGDHGERHCHIVRFPSATGQDHYLRGTEFANWPRTIALRVYFADPYCAWQKGTNENLNACSGSFIPKGRNLSRVAPPH